VLLTRLIDKVARTDGPRVLAGLIRLTGGDFDAAEEALQEAYAPRAGGLAPGRPPGAARRVDQHRVAARARRRAATRNDAPQAVAPLDDDVADTAAAASPAADVEGAVPTTRPASRTIGCACSSSAAIRPCRRRRKRRWRCGRSAA
jgi:predicted RNA polymerase sigma factor